MVKVRIMLRIAGIVKESITDGEGLRLVIFAQGCAHKCPGCHNPETHSFEGGYQIEDEEIIDLILKNPLLDGVTSQEGIHSSRLKLSTSWRF